MTPPSVEGTPFPTLFWLTCPWLIEEVSRLESAGGAREWVERLAHDSELADRMRAADLSYRELRAAAGGGEDPCEGVGIAGQRDPLATKCLHAHVAAYLAGIDDPVGSSVMEGLVPECADERCAVFADESRE